MKSQLRIAQNILTNRTNRLANDHLLADLNSSDNLLLSQSLQNTTNFAQDRERRAFGVWQDAGIEGQGLFLHR